MKTKMLINAVDAEEFRLAVIKYGQLDGFHIETAMAEQKIGNIYKGVVERIAPNLQACFVNFGSDKNGFLAIADIHPEYYIHKFQESEKDKGLPPIEKVIKRGQEILVQVTKEMPGHKGVQLTTYLSLASRHLVLLPGGKGGVSKKIEDEEERQRLKSIMNQLNIPENIGYIVRTAARKQSKRVLSRDLNRLVRMWRNIKKRVEKAPALSLIHKEQDICLRTLRDYFTSEIGEVLVDDKDTFANVKDYMKIISPRDMRKVRFYKEKRPIFAHYEIEQQIETIYGSKVPLKSGGSLVIDPTEALIAIDVNSGRGRGEKDVETTAFNTNREAAPEIARQLRLRDMGGLVVIDFIDMKEKKHIREIERIMRDEIKQDRARTNVSNISRFGLMELSRQRLRPSIESISYETCRYCQGRGLIPSVEAASVYLLRQIWMGVSKPQVKGVKGVLPLEVATYLQNKKRKALAEIESRYGVAIELQSDPTLAPGNGQLEFIKENGGS